jgi:hypothetical protein
MEYYYSEVTRNSLFKNRYMYKAHLRASVLWKEAGAHWNNEEDRDYMEEVESFLKFKFPDKDVAVQGAVVYCNDLDVIFTVRLRYDERLIKIEKAEVK